MPWGMLCYAMLCYAMFWDAMSGDGDGAEAGAGVGDEEDLTVACAMHTRRKHRMRFDVGC